MDNMETLLYKKEKEVRYENFSITSFPFKFESETNDNREIYADKDISHGGFGKTYKGRYLTREGNLKGWKQVPVVIKQFYLSDSVLEYIYSKDESDKRIQGYLERFKNESEILAKIDDDNIVHVIHSFSTNGTSYYVMEYISGMELFKYIPNKKPFSSFEKAWKYYRPICVALSMLHSKGIAHRDIQPRNILVKTKVNPDERNTTDDIDRFVLIDFGNCKSPDEDKNLTRFAPAGYTYYSAPEMRPNKGKPCPDLCPEAYKKCDIYSIGAVLYYILTGNLPPEDIEKEELEIPYYMSWQVVDIIKKAMMPAIKDRYQTVQAFIEACDRAIKTSFDANAQLNISPQITLGELQQMGTITVSVPADDKTMNSMAILNRTWKEIIGSNPTDNYKVGDFNFKRITLRAVADTSGNYQLIVT